MKAARRLAIVVLAMLGLAVLVALFVAYQNPAMLVDFANLAFCG